MRRPLAWLAAALLASGAGSVAADPAPGPPGSAAVQPDGAPTRAAAAYSAAALFNLANAYAHAGQPGLAVLNYQRASLLAPDDADIDANLRYVRATAHLPAPARSRLEHAATLAGPGLASWLGLGGVALLGGSLLAGRVRRDVRWLRGGATLLGVALVGIPAANLAALWPTLHAAVAITGNASARVSPVPMGDPLFTLTEAETVTIRAQHEDFVLIRTAAGKSGWVSTAEAVPVVPRGGP